MTLIAIEEHWLLPEVATALQALPPGQQDISLSLNEVGDTRQRLEDVGAGRIATMDEQGIDVALLALTPPGTQPLPADQSVALSRAANDAASAAVAAHPDRFRALSTLPLAAPDEVVAELERAHAAGHVGVMIYPRAGELRIDDPEYDDFFAAAADLGQPVFLHPQLPPVEVRDTYYDGFDDLPGLALATFGWGWHMDAGLAALRLILKGTFERHPALQMVLGHWGQMLLFWTDRADSIARVAGAPRSVSDTLRSNFFITSSGMYNPALLQHALTVTTPDRLIFSTDYPFQKPTKETIDGFLAHFDSDTDRAGFSSENAVRLFGL